LPDKNLGNIYTPEYIVKMILDIVDYKGEHILHKTIMEPSCGDGAFLKEIVSRLIIAAKEKNLNNDEIKILLEKNITAIEIVEEELEKAKSTISDIAAQYGIKDVNWNFYCIDALKYKNKEAFDFVIGNPPYVRVHNLDEKKRIFIKSNFKYCSSGTTDLYMSFYEFGINLLKKNGKLCYITPNSFMFNKTAKFMRNDLLERKLLRKIINFKDFQVFDNATTYTAIVLLENNLNSDTFDYEIFNGNKIVHIRTLKFDDTIDKYKTWCFDSEIINKNKNKNMKYVVQNGLATLCDKIFISSDVKKIDDKYVMFNGYKIESDILKPIIKASKNDLKERFAIFPYISTSSGIKAINEEDFKVKFPCAYEYLLVNKDVLLKRDLEKNRNWYEYGRSQGLANILKKKICVSSVVKNNVLFREADNNTLVYSGLFITLKDETYSFEDIKKILDSTEFLEYVHKTCKYMRGGYKSLSAEKIKEYLKKDI